MELETRVAIVTGAGVRLGRAMALALAVQGARLVIHYYSSAEPALETVAQIRDRGGEAIIVQADLNQPRQAPILVEQAVAHYGRIDILVNSAAIFEPGEWDNTTEENWDRHFDINLKSPFFLTQAFARQVGPDRRAHVVNIVDWRALHPGTDHVAYTIAKAGLVTMTHSLALALAPNIQVNAIAPGMILPPPGQDETYLAHWADKIPARRIGSPEEVIKALLYLLQADFVTGEVIYVTGGEHLIAGKQP